MTATGGFEEAKAGLEGAYRRLLRWYPAPYRRRHEEEILGVLMFAAQPGQRRPGARDSLNLLWSALKIRIRTTLRGADSRPWAAALALAGVLLPLLMVLLKLTDFLYGGALRGFGSPADVLVGGYGDPGAYAQLFQHNPYSVALTGNIEQALTAGPVPALILAALACAGWRRTAAVFAGLIPLAYLGISLTGSFTLLAGPAQDVVLYVYGLEALILFAAPGAPRGWRALQRRPSALLAVATAGFGVALNGGILPLLPHAPFRGPVRSTGQIRGFGLFQHRVTSIPHGVVGVIDRPLGIEVSGWANWLVYQGTLAAVVAVALTIMLLSSPANRRALFLLAVPFALGAVIYLLSLINPPPPGLAGNAIAVLPLLLILLTAMAFSLVPRRPADLDTSSRPATPGNT
jgi:hypothetical protein